MNKKQLIINNKSVTYIQEGRGPVLLFIHGWSITPKTYEKTIRALSSYFTVYAPYLRETKVSMKQWPSALHEFITMLSLSPLYVLGHSSSGVTAVELADMYPKQIKGVILLDTLGIVPSRSALSWFRIWLLHVGHLFTDAKRHTSFSIVLFQDFISQVLFHPLSLIYEIIYAIKTNISYKVAHVTMPVLIIWGKQDDLVPVEYGYKLEKLFPKATIHVVPGGHGWFKTEPQLLVKYVEEFAKKNT